MTKTMVYRDLNHALRQFKKQVTASLPYAITKCPKLESPEAVFNWLKARTTYKHDPRGVELFQKVQTLLTENNFHGIQGAGDCDCFTIAALALLLANGFTDCGIVLAGRGPRTAVHIWAYCNYQGRRVNLDLTNKYFDQTRHYPYTQYIPYHLNQKEKSMLLQLAEGSRKRGSVQVSAHKRRFPLHEGAIELSSNASRPFPYIYLPNTGIQVREDVFDNMSAGEFQNMCLSEGVPVPEIVELSAKRAERKAAKANKGTVKVQKKADKQAARVQKKEIKQTARTQQKESRPIRQLIKGRAERKNIKAQGKADQRNIKASGRADSKFIRAEGRANRPRISGEDKADLIRGAANFGGSLVGTFTGRDISPFGPDTPTQQPEPKREEKPKTGFQQFMESTINIFGTEIPTPAAAVGGAVLAGLAYKALK